MKKDTLKLNLALLLLLILIVGCYSEKEKASQVTSWKILGFEKADNKNPVLLPGNLTFECPIRKEVVKWEEKDVFNPAAVVKDGRIHLIFRAEDVVGKHAGTSRLGLATSKDGYHFTKLQEPIFYPDHDSMNIYEWEGGVEDPRIVESEAGKYIMTYTSYDGKTARLCLASSDDLIHWEKHGLVLGQALSGKYRDLWSKSGAIVCKQQNDKLIATKVQGKYWMYWGDTDIFVCVSNDLIHWLPVEDESGEMLKVFGPRKGKFDNQLVEPGPPPLLTEKGIVMIYNSRNHDATGIPELAPGTYTAGQVLIDKNDPKKVIDRTDDYFFQPEKDYEINGQVGNVVFLEALVPFQGKWFLYYGTADSKIAVAVK